jgi:hypothetical protein
MPIADPTSSMLRSAGGVAAGADLFGVSRGDKRYADRSQSILDQANWDEARGRLQPLLGRMNFAYNNATGRDEMVQGAAGLADGAFQGSLRSAARSLSSRGITLNAQQQASFDDSAGVAGGLARISAKNMASRGYDTLRDQIATGAP